MHKAQAIYSHKHQQKMNRNYTIYSINLETILIKGHRE